MSVLSCSTPFKLLTELGVVAHTNDLRLGAL